MTYKEWISFKMGDSFLSRLEKGGDMFSKETKLYKMYEIERILVRLSGGTQDYIDKVNKKYKKFKNGK